MRPAASTVVMSAQRQVRRAVFLLVCLIVLVGGSAKGLLAQGTNATINGQITDSQGRSVPGVEVQAVNIDTNVVYPGKTNDSGIYVIPSVPPGRYRLLVLRDGFKEINKTGLVLHVQDTLQQNFALEVGSISESVTVEAGAFTINTTDASVSTVIDRHFVESLPLNGRSFNTLLQLTPGVVIAPINTNGPPSTGQFSVAGQRADSNNFTVDGVSANFGATPLLVPGKSGLGASQALSAVGGTSSLVSVDALQEFRVETSSFSPEFGRSPGGQVILTTRSGTNAFHGDAFDYFRNNVMDANDWFSNRASLQRAPERHNDFGGTVGGPIWRDKTFFFFSYEGARLRLPQTTVDDVPSSSARSSAPPALAPYLNVFEQPNGPVDPSGFTAQYTGAFSNQATLNATSLRIDHHFNSRFSIFARYNYAPSQLFARGAPPSGGSPNTVLATTANVQTATFGLDMLISGGALNTIRGNFSTQASYNVYALDTFGGAVPPAPNILFANLPTAATWVNFVGFIDTLSSPIVGPNAKNRTKQFNVTDVFARQIAQHSLKFGADFRELYLNAKSDRFQVLLSLDTVQNFLASGTADFLGLQTFNPGRIRSDSLSLFAQDNWKLTRRLTLTYGLRWELNPAPAALSGTTLAAWTNVNNPAAIAVAPPGTPLWNTVYTNFGPRIGAAYALNDAGDFVLRAGWGSFYDLGSGVASSVLTGWPNQSFMSNFNVSLPIADMTPYLPLAHTLQSRPIGSFGASIFAFSPDLKVPRSYQWNVALEKSFGGHQAISATYVGQSGNDLLRIESTLAPNANFAPGSLFELTNNSAASNYQALQLQYRRPLTSRLQALLNYSWSHSIDNASNDLAAFFSNTVVVLSAQQDRGNSDFDVRHSFSGAFTYELPSPKKLAPFSYLARDWFLDGVVVARSGFPFTAILRAGSPIGFIARRANLVPGQPLWTTNATAPGGKMLNANAFSAPPAGTQGNEGRNIIPGVGFTQVDLSLGRKFPISERVNLQFRADAFNVLNHPNFTNPLAILQSAPSFLQSSKMLNQGLGGLNPLFQEGGPRSLQLSLNLRF